MHWTAKDAVVPFDSKNQFLCLLPLFIRRTTLGREVLTWVAAFAAFSIAGHYRMEQEFYEAIKGWIAGMAMLAASQADVTQ